MAAPHRPVSDKIFNEIARSLAGGDSSGARLRTGQQVVVDRAAGARIWDADGHGYLDYCMGYGVNLFGHAPDFVLDAVARTAARLGLHVAFPHRLAGEVADLIVGMVPGVEQVRFANSGTEATQAALRLVRAVTGRDVILKFEAHYHGWADHVCTGMDAGSAPAHPGPAAPDSPGVPASALAAIWTLRWNDLDVLDAAIAAAGARLAGVICEVVTGSGVIEPAPGYLAALVERVRTAGGLAIFDEVMTGFRVARGGAQERYGVTADVTTLAKVIGGGMPVGAFGASREIMAWEADNRVFHAGTYTGGPAAMAAAAAVLGRLAAEPDLYEVLEARSARLATGLEAAMAGTGVAGHVRRVGSMLLPVFGPRPRAEPTGYAAVAAVQRGEIYRSFCDGLEAGGVFAHRYPMGRWFVSLAHTDDDIETTIDAAGAALRRL